MHPIVLQTNTPSWRRYTTKARLLASPIAYWPLGEGAGTTANDVSGNARNGAYAAVTLGAVGIGDGRTAASLNGSTSVINVFSAAFSTAFNGGEGSFCGFLMLALAQWTDGVLYRAFNFLVDGNNSIRLDKTTTNNQLSFTYRAGGTSKTVTSTASPAGTAAWIHCAVTWSKAGDAVKCYVGGAQIGATQTGLGTWAGALSSSTTVVGANNTTPTNGWLGNLAHVLVCDTPLSAATIAAIATVP